MVDVSRKGRQMSYTDLAGLIGIGIYVRMGRRSSFLVVLGKNLGLHLSSSINNMKKHAIGSETEMTRVCPGEYLDNI